LLEEGQPATKTVPAVDNAAVEEEQPAEVATGAAAGQQQGLPSQQQQQQHNDNDNDNKEEEQETAAVAPPDIFCCPITLGLMREPVLLVQDTHTYERSALEAWFTCTCLRERGEPLRSPKTGLVFAGEPALVVNQSIKTGVLEWEAQQQKRRHKEGWK
jgi:hypothetical protein